MAIFLCSPLASCQLEPTMSGPIAFKTILSAIAALARRHRLRVIGGLMLVLTVMVFETNGSAPGGVNLRPRNRSETMTLACDRPAQRLATDP